MARVRLINPAAVQPSAISDICVAAALPPGEVALIVGEPTLPENYQGVTIARTLDGNVFGLNCLAKNDWDCGVIIGSKWASLQAEFPAYFAYLLGHEFGHTTTVLTDIWLTAYQYLILRDIGRVSIREWRWDEMPHEAMYDAFGIAVAEEIFGRASVEAEFSTIISRELSEDVPRLQKVLRLSASKDLKGLRTALAGFTLPWKDQLLNLWREDQSRGGKIATGLRRIEALWEIPPETSESGASA
jgi:hypothetical protein